MKKWIIFLISIVVVLITATPANAYKLSIIEAEVETRVEVSDQADDDCLDMIEDADSCDYASYPEAGCWRINKRKMRCRAKVEFNMWGDWSDIDSEDWTKICYYRTTVRESDYWGTTVRITSGPSGCWPL